ncbi:MAG: NAD(P)/FAD-dependent oxidoreductase [Actinomycetales bacterium]|nr:NAD(P)/FAD-dependent oxidoreductase [Actinomycetales bacterium]
MIEHFDVAVLGMGPGGEVAAGRLLKAGKKVAVIERELIGGECAYWACIPSKTLLRPGEARTGVQRAAGVSGAELNWSEASKYRDYMIRHLDDKAQMDGYGRDGATVIKGEARITAPGQIRVGDRELTADQIIIATGSEPIIPDLEGVDQITAWTNRETYTATTLPKSAVIIGGSAVGTETSTFLASFGVKVTLIHRGDRLLEREEPRVGELAFTYLVEAGIDIRLGVTAKKAHRTGETSVIELDDGTEVSAEVIIFATGRTPRTQNLGFELADVILGDHGQVQVDEHCQAAENVWAVGDVTGILPFTHVAKYQGRIVADAILGGDRRAFYQGIPRVVFTDPEIAAAGLTQAQADQQGLKTEATEIDLATSISRPWTYEENPRGHLGLLMDTERNVLIGAWAIAPLAGEWIHQASLAIRAHIPIDTLLDQVAQYPSYNEAYLAALEKLRPA